MARQRTGPAALQDNGRRVRIMLTLTVDESAKVDAARGSIPAATWCRELVLRALAEPKP